MATLTRQPAVRDVMTKRLAVVSPDTPFKTIAALMRHHRVSALPVVDEDFRPVGIVSEADLLPKELAAGSAASDHAFDAALGKAAARVARDLMSRPVISVGPQTSLPEAARVMVQRDVRRLPVVDHHGRLCGIISRGDVLDVFLESDATMAHRILYGAVDEMLFIDPACVNVEVKAGVVHISGRLPQRSMAPLLLSTIRRMPGVIGVDDELTWEWDDLA